MLPKRLANTSVSRENFTLVNDLTNFYDNLRAIIELEILQLY